jgi:hypothetical protein
MLSKDLIICRLFTRFCLIVSICINRIGNFKRLSSSRLRMCAGHFASVCNKKIVYGPVHARP